MELIRTGLRDKLPKGLSYPAGAEAISIALLSVPQYHSLWISFSKTGWMSIERDREISDATNFMHVLSVILNFESGGMYLSIPAVPSKYRQIVRQGLTNYGLPEVRDWLAVPHSQTWHEGFRTFEVGLGIHSDEICLVERQNHEVLTFRRIATTNSATTTI